MKKKSGQLNLKQFLIFFFFLVITKVPSKIPNGLKKFIEVFNEFSNLYINSDYLLNYPITKEKSNNNDR